MEHLASSKMPVAVLLCSHQAALFFIFVNVRIRFYGWIWYRALLCFEYIRKMLDCFHLIFPLSAKAQSFKGQDNKNKLYNRNWCIFLALYFTMHLVSFDVMMSFFLWLHKALSPTTWVFGWWRPSSLPPCPSEITSEINWLCVSGSKWMMCVPFVFCVIYTWL